MLAAIKIKEAGLMKHMPFGFYVTKKIEEMLHPREIQSFYITNKMKNLEIIRSLPQGLYITKMVEDRLKEEESQMLLAIDKLKQFN